MKAKNVLQAARKAFMEANDDEAYCTYSPPVLPSAPSNSFWCPKSLRFIAMSGVVLDTMPDQQLDEGRIKQAVFTMMDMDTRELFWKHLAELEGKDETD
ncbi:MAG: hypothetical protein FWE76_05395 [Symbiobacteriaceae bacterium]|nr:hypothetical protein [Symbiobacteriaceae bacterium]